MTQTRLGAGQLKPAPEMATDAEVAAALNAHVNDGNPHPQYQTTVSTKASLGLDKVDNTADASKPISTATQTALDLKQAKINFVPLNKAGDVMTGSLGLPKAPGTGFTVEGAFGWRDLIGDITPRSSGSLAPLLKNFIGNVREWTYSTGDQGDSRFHLPHDYVPGTDLFIHVHWSHNGTAITGTFKVDFYLTYAKGHGQSVFQNTINQNLTVTGLNVTNTPKAMHRVDEVQISMAGGSVTMLDTSQLEVDGMILVNYVITTIPSISGSISANTPYIFGIDIHYQSNGMATKNKSPSFYA